VPFLIQCDYVAGTFVALLTGLLRLTWVTVVRQSKVRLDRERGPVDWDPFTYTVDHGLASQRKFGF
jgi:hypothetical protein